MATPPNEIKPSPSNDEVEPLPRKDVARGRSLIGVIHASTSTVDFSVYTAADFKRLQSASEEVQLLMPNDGWFEQDAAETMSAIYQCCAEVCAMLPSRGYRKEDILCVSITNQRETTVMWDVKTGKPLCKAIVWNDIRTSTLVDRFLKQQIAIKKSTGLPLSPYFSALKILWMQENIPEVRKAMKSQNCRAGTLDTWIVWNLTRGKIHVTDVTNASRTLLMNLKTLDWDPTLLKLFGIKANVLPQIRSSSEIFGRITAQRSVLKEVLICGIIGDQQASLVGQLCLERGQVNCHYGLGCFVLCNTGPQRVESKRGLITTVAYKMGPNARVIYALEGSVAVGGRVFDWLANKVRILPNADEAEIYAKSVNSTCGLYFVPAFTGLYAPYWRKDARGVIVGLKEQHTAKHIVRAAHEAICYQTRDILEFMQRECGISPTKLHADGKHSTNKTLMQLQADIAGVHMIISTRPDRTSFGAALCAAHAYSFDLGAVKSNTQAAAQMTVWPKITRELREIGYCKWQCAVKSSLNWAIHKIPKRYKRYKCFIIIISLAIALIAIAVYVYQRYYGIKEDDWTDLYPPPPLSRRQMRRASN